jgi:phospholipid-binding lipoprotein MlaA
VGLDAVRIRANYLPADKVVEEAAMDKYSFIRDAWRQRRRSQVYDGKPPVEPED